MSASTSRLGRCQFSVEKANSVRYLMPRRRLVSTTARTESLPRWWPSMRLRPRCNAQRPLPSMMMATWRGRRSRSRPGVPVLATRSDLHDLVFFGLENLIDAFDVLLGGLLRFFLAAP